MEIRLMSIQNDNSFKIKSNVNFDNARETLKFLIENNNNFTNNVINESIVKLDWLLRFPDAPKDTYLSAPKCNKTYSDLLERYVHISAFDPCAYVREIRNLLFAGTNTVELDVTAEAVYIYAKYISKDIDLLQAYENGDIYKILQGYERDEQKVLMNKWLQGGYNSKLPYNELFPITANYLKKTATWDDGAYKRNSGLFRDIETRNLMAICKSVKGKITNHLHDGVYTTERGLKDVEKAYKEIYGNALKYKVHHYKNDVCDFTALTKRDLNSIKNLNGKNQWKPTMTEAEIQVFNKNKYYTLSSVNDWNDYRFTCWQAYKLNITNEYVLTAIRAYQISENIRH